MSIKKDIIKEALVLNGVTSNDVTVITTEKHHIQVHILELIVLLLYNFTLLHNMSGIQIVNFIMLNFETILNIVLTELEIAVLNFANLYKFEELKDVIELDNKDTCMLIVAIQNIVNKKLEKIM